VKYLLLIPILLLSGCGKSEGLTQVPAGGYLPADVAPSALTAVIQYENLNRFGQPIRSISTTENSGKEIKLRVVTGSSETFFTLIPDSSGWQISDVQ
jgi:hypothetical protein